MKIGHWFEHNPLISPRVYEGILMNICAFLYPLWEWQWWKVFYFQIYFRSWTHCFYWSTIHICHSCLHNSWRSKQGNYLGGAMQSLVKGIISSAVKTCCSDLAKSSSDPHCSSEWQFHPTNTQQMVWAHYHTPSTFNHYPPPPPPPFHSVIPPSTLPPKSPAPLPLSPHYWCYKERLHSISFTS